MSPRLRIALSCLLLLGVAVWLFRGGDEAPAPEAQAPRPDAATMNRRGDQPRAREMGETSSAEAPMARRPKRPAGNTDLAPPALGGAVEPLKPVDPDDDDDLQEMITAALQARDPSERAAAIADLSLRDDLKPVEPVIREAANDPDPDVKMAVIAAMGQFGEAVPMDLLNRFAADPDPEVRLEVLDLVETLAEEASIPPLVQPLLEQFARDPNEEVRDKAQDVIEQLSESDDSEPDLPNLNDPELVQE